MSPPPFNTAFAIWSRKSRVRPERWGMPVMDPRSSVVYVKVYLPMVVDCKRFESVVMS